MPAKKSNERTQSTKLELPIPLEYCKVDRAARLLNCEVQDVIHSACIGGTNICLKNAGPGTLHEIEHKDEIKNNHDIACLIRKLYESYELINLSLYSSLDISVNSSFYYPDLVKMDDDEVAEVPVYFDGFWAIESFDILDEFADLIDHGQSDLLIPDGEIGIFSPTYNENEYIYKGVINTPNEYISGIQLRDLYVLRPDLEKLYKSIKHSEPLANRFNDVILAEKARKQEKSERQLKNKTRETVPQANMIRALIRALIGNDDDLMKQPYKLFPILQTTLAAKGIACPIQTADSLKRWLDISSNDD